jgi:hypothetical protein
MGGGFGRCHNQSADCGAHRPKVISLLSGALIHIKAPINFNHDRQDASVLLVR